MSDYTITTDFGAKDSLPSGNAAKIIKGSEFTTEFTNIKTAVNTKADTTGDTFTGAVTFDAAVTNNAAVTVNSTATITGDLTVDTNTLFVDVSEDKVGIGTVTPDSALEVQGSINGVTQIHIQNTFDDDDEDAPNPSARLYLSAASNNAYIQCKGAPTDLGTQHQIDFGSAAAGSFLTFSPNISEKMRIDSSGNVGIGTSSPSYTLDIEADTAQARIHSTVGNSVLRLDSVDDGESKIYFADNSAAAIGTIEYHHNTNHMSFATGATTRMLINSSGNVGIGTTSPVNKLHVLNTGTTAISNAVANSGAILDGGTGNIGLNMITPNTGACYINFGDSADSNVGRLVYNHNNNSMTFDTNATERMRIDSSGNLLVGTTAIPTDDNTTLGFGVTSSGEVRASVNNGNAAMFKRASSDGDIIEFRKDSTTVGSISVTGSATSYNTSSDERLKENITDSADAGSKVDAIQIRQFDWKADGTHQDYGVIAQELINVAPEAVSEGDTEEDMMGVDYSKLVPMLIKEVQTLRNRVAQLENN